MPLLCWAQILYTRAQWKLGTRSRSARSAASREACMASFQVSSICCPRSVVGLIRTAWVSGRKLPSISCSVCARGSAKKKTANGAAAYLVVPKVVVHADVQPVQEHVLVHKLHVRRAELLLQPGLACFLRSTLRVGV